MQLRHAPFKDRRDAGRQLAATLNAWKDAQPVVLALPRGGVPVGFEVADGLQAPLDIVLVRKIGAPGHAELGLGAVVDGEHPLRVMNEGMVDALQVPEAYVENEVRRQLLEIERRRQLYCNSRPALPIENRVVIVVDDGIATGGTMRVALKALATAKPERLMFAVPVGAAETVASLRQQVDEGICLMTPEPFGAVGLYYDDFAQTTDEEVVELLHAAALQTQGGVPPQ
jgi:putative phosphoribosyl transferase